MVGMKDYICGVPHDSTSVRILLKVQTDRHIIIGFCSLVDKHW